MSLVGQITLLAQRVATEFNNRKGTAVPLVDTTAGAVGTSLLYARQDHAHPSILPQTLPAAGNYVLTAGAAAPMSFRLMGQAYWEGTFTATVATGNTIVVPTLTAVTNALTINGVAAATLAANQFAVINGSIWMAELYATSVTTNIGIQARIQRSAVTVAHQANGATAGGLSPKVTLTALIPAAPTQIISFGVTTTAASTVTGRLVLTRLAEVV